MDAARQRVAEVVTDPQTAASLMPYYRLLCKRTGFHDEFLPAFNRPNVTLVDTAGVGVEQVTPNGVVVDGVEYELDCLIFATGFDLGRGLIDSWNVDLVGVDGQRLTDHWEKGTRTFHGVHVHHFPNLFLNALSQTAGPANFTSNAVELGEHIAWVIKEARARGISRVEATEEAESSWVDTIHSLRPQAQVDFLRSCTPGYYSNEGALDDARYQGNDVFFGGIVPYYDLLRSWREAGELAGLTTR